MKIGLFLKDKPILKNFANHFVDGLHKHELKYSLYNPDEIYDLIVSFTFNNKAQKIIEKQKKHGGKFLTIKSPVLHPKGVVGFKEKEEWCNPFLPSDQIYVYTELLDKDYARCWYKKGHDHERLSQNNYFSWLVDDSPRWHTEGYILICEQFRPEGIGHNFKTRKQWTRWIWNTYNQIRKIDNSIPVSIRTHPGRPRWKSLGEDMFLDIPPSVEILPTRTLFEDLYNAKCLITVSSKTTIEAFLHGVPIFTLNQNCPTYNVSYSCVKNVINPPYYYDRYQWLCDMAYCHWSLKELSNGDYLDYLFSLKILEK